MDVDTLRPGTDFITEVERVIGSCDIVLVLIGPFWAVTRDNRRRLDNPKDVVRLEVAASLAAWRQKRTHLIPVLAPSAPVPTEEELPDELRGLERINAVKLSDDYWDASIDALLKSVAGALAASPPRPSASVREPAPRPSTGPAVEPTGAPDVPGPPPTRHFARVAAGMSKGDVAFFLGAGVNLCERGPDAWQAGVSRFPPSSAELAGYVSRQLGLDQLLDIPEAGGDLATVADYAETMLGQAPLYDVLRRVLDSDYSPTIVHLALARLPRLLRDHGGYAPLIATLNQDDIVERAFSAEGEEYDVVSYVATGEHRGKFLHYPAGGDAIVVDQANAYTQLAMGERPVILKLLGGIDRVDPERDSYVVSEGDQLEYASRGDLSQSIPIEIRAKLRNSNLLFLGMSPRSRVVRIVLEKVFAGQRLLADSWAIQRESDLLSRSVWNRRHVEVLDVQFLDYVPRLMEELEATIATAPGP
jgi:SIR2-like domain